MISTVTRVGWDGRTVKARFNRQQIEAGRAPDVWLFPGDVVYVSPVADKPGAYTLEQVPEIEGAIVAMDPRTGRVLALVGGFSFAESEFNRATQALRQPGSSFKPIVYSAALDNGYTPASVVLDAPIEVVNSDGSIWRPEISSWCW